MTRSAIISAFADTWLSLSRREGTARDRRAAALLLSPSRFRWFLYRPLPTQDKQEMHFHVESLGEPITSSTGKRTEYQTGTVRVESGHVMKALFFHPTKVTENSFYYRGKGP